MVGKGSPNCLVPVGLAMLLALLLGVGAAPCIRYSAPGDPCLQGWKGDIRGITVGDVADVVDGATRHAWGFDSRKGEKGWYLNSHFEKMDQRELLQKGWTWTYVARTRQAPSRGYHSAKFRDGNRLWELQFRQNGSSANGLWLRLGTRNDKLLKEMSLDDGYHVFQMTCTPASPGSYDDNDLITVYVDGQKVYAMRRGQQGQATGIFRGEMVDEAVGAAGAFSVRLYEIKAGTELAPNSPGAVKPKDLPRETPNPGSETIDIADRRELFVDKALIEDMDGAELRMHHPQPAGKVLEFNEEWEGAFAGYGTIIKDGDQYRMYYRAGREAHGLTNQVTCLALSKDGVHWSKPELGLYEFNGSKSNNIVFSDKNVAGHNFSPFLDTNPDCAADERYKALGGLYRYTKDPEVKGLLGFASPDGIHWKQVGGNPLIARPEFNAFDSQNVVFWSPKERKYVCFCRVWPGTKPAEDNYFDAPRWIGKTTSDDFIHWSPIEIMEILHDGEEVPKYDLYTNQTFPYCRAPHMYIATAIRFMEGRQVISDAQAKEIGVDPRYYKDCSDAILLSMRSGSGAYRQTFLSSFLRPGPGIRNWVSRTNYPLLNILPTSGTEMSMYVNKDYAQPTAHVQRYSLRIDGFASAHAPFAGGTLLSKPIRFEGNELELNFWTSAAGAIQVELQDKNGTPIEGYALEDCQEIIGNEISRTVRWKGNTDVGMLSGKEIRLLFKIKDADLYSFRFKEAGDGKNKGNDHEEKTQ